MFYPEQVIINRHEKIPSQKFLYAANSYGCAGVVGQISGQNT